MSPTALTLRQLRREGWTVQVVEHWNGYARIRQDLFGGIDILACDPVRGILGVQCCGASTHAAHKAKLLAEVRMATWVAAGGRLEIWSWETRRSEERTKAGKRSKRLVHHCRREALSLADFVPRESAA